MIKRLLTLALIALFCQFTGSYAQTVVRIDNTAPYSPGSDIAALFNLGTDCFKIGNKFNLYLSDASGNFISPTLIGTYNGFYTTFVNGTIPAGTPAGTGYRLRVQSTNPVSTSAISDPFEIKVGAISKPSLNSPSKVSKPGDPVTFGKCNTDANIKLTTFRFVNESNTGNVSVSFTNELQSAPVETITYSSLREEKPYNATLAHFTVFVKAAMPDGSIGTKAYFLVNNLAVTAFTTTSGNTICFPVGTFEYSVNTSMDKGIKANFPGNTYKIDWGDNTTDEYTFCDIANNNDRVSHTYTKSSCGLSYQSGNQTVYNAFGVNVGVISPFCGPTGSPLSTPARVVTRPENRFSFPPVACTNDAITFENESLPGEQASTNSPRCAPNDVAYNWYVDGVLVQSAKPLSYDFVHTFESKGIHKIRLSSISDGGCQADDLEMTICVQERPKPSFTLPSNLICLAQAILKPTNNSILDNTCPATPVYTWTVTPAQGVGYVNGTGPASKEPQFKFDKIGVYNITLSVKTATCVETTAPQEVVINTDPQALLSPDINLCEKGRYEFNPTATVTKTTLTGTAKDLDGTYFWEVSGGSHTFESPTTDKSKYPVIIFNEYAKYTVKVTHKNNCNTTSATQVIQFSQAPVPTITANKTTVCNTENINLTGSITGSYTSVKWSNGTNDNGFSNSANLITTYTPTTAEKLAGSATLILTVNTSSTGDCAQVSKQIQITILPQNKLTNTPANKSICTGSAVNFIPTSDIANTTFTWTVENPDGLVQGFNPSGSGTINDVLTNSSGTNTASVIYTIIPKSNGCTGDPFTLTVSVTPKPGLNPVLSKPIICSGEPAAITLNPTLPGTLFSWTSTATGVTGNSSQTGAALTAINDILTNTSSTEGTVIYTITPNLPNGCEGEPVIIAVKVYPPIIANAGTDESLCNETSYLLKGNNPSFGIGKWTVSPTGPLILNDALYNSQVTGLSPGQKYIFTWTITGGAGCSETDDVIIDNLNPIATNTINVTNPVICGEQSITIEGSIPTGGNGVYSYKWETSTDNGNNWTTVSDATNQNLTADIKNSSLFRRIVASATCDAVSDAVSIRVLPPVSGNTISGAQTICNGNTPAPLTGTMPSGGDGSNYTYQWEESIDNGVNWTTLQGATRPTFTPGPLNMTTLYRRKASSGICNGSTANISNSITITVNPDALADFTYTSNLGCAPFKIDNQNIQAIPHPGNGVYTWYVNDIFYATGIEFPEYTIANDNDDILIKLVVSSSNNCKPSEKTVKFSTRQSITASFRQDLKEGCGPLTVNFENTSNSFVNANFEWDFGNGATSGVVMPPPVIFQPHPMGKDTTYTVTLKATTPCGTTEFTSSVFVKAQPISVFSPDKTVGCSPMKVTFSNTSPGGTNTYYYDFGDGTFLTKNDKSSVEHVYITRTVKDYIVKMRAENDCGSHETSYTIRVSPNTVLPELVVNSNEKVGCAPFNVNFYNNSKGANMFRYDFGDGTTKLTRSAPETVQHTFASPGTYTIVLTASNGCSDTTTTETITVLEQPITAFSANNTVGCPNLEVKFTNTSTGAVSYLWDFGDGTTSNEFEPTHIYSGSLSSYTVTLTSINDLNCPNTVIKPDFIRIIQPPVAQFSVNPGTVISIPSYSFSFIDESSNDPDLWEWDFGDGTKSTERNPKHVYADTGGYRVTLKVINQNGCFSTTFKDVRITGVPGYLFVPNSFIPGSETNELRVFKAKGSGIKSWRMSVFNKWGQLLWETTKLDEGHPAEGWDGTFKNTQLPQSVYFWKIDVQFINGFEWKGMTYDNSAPKRTGAIHLIR